MSLSSQTRRKFCMIRCGRTIVFSLVPVFVSILFKIKGATGYLQSLICFSLFFSFAVLYTKVIKKKKE